MQFGQQPQVQEKVARHLWGWGAVSGVWGDTCIRPKPLPHLPANAFDAGGLLRKLPSPFVARLQVNGARYALYPVTTLAPGRGAGPEGSPPPPPSRSTSCLHFTSITSLSGRRFDPRRHACLFRVQLTRPLREPPKPHQGSQPSPSPGLHSLPFILLGGPAPFELPSVDCVGALTC